MYKEIRIFLFILFLSGNAFAGWEILQTVKETTGGKKAVSRVRTRVSGHLMRSDISSSMGNIIYISNDRNAFVCFDALGKKQCMKMLVGGNFSFLAPLKQMGMKIEYNKIAVSPSKRTRKILGYSCRMHKIQANIEGKMEMKIPGAKPYTMRMGTEYQGSGCYTLSAGHGDMVKHSLKMMRAMNRSLTRKTQQGLSRWVGAGFLLEGTEKIRSKHDKKINTSIRQTSTQSIKKVGTFSRGLFQLPPGYVVMETPKFGGKPDFRTLAQASCDCKALEKEARKKTKRKKRKRPSKQKCACLCECEDKTKKPAQLKKLGKRLGCEVCKTESPEDDLVDPDESPRDPDSDDLEEELELEDEIKSRGNKKIKGLIKDAAKDFLPF